MLHYRSRSSCNNIFKEKYSAYITILVSHVFLQNMPDIDFLSAFEHRFWFCRQADSHKIENNISHRLIRQHAADTSAAYLLFSFY